MINQFVYLKLQGFSVARYLCQYIAQQLNYTVNMTIYQIFKRQTEISTNNRLFTYIHLMLLDKVVRQKLILHQILFFKMNAH